MRQAGSPGSAGALAPLVGIPVTCALATLWAFSWMYRLRWEEGEVRPGWSLKTRGSSSQTQTTARSSTVRSSLWANTPGKDPPVDRSPTASPA